MKKLIYSLVIILGICFTSLSQPSGYTPIYKLWSTNILMESSLGGTNRILPGNIQLGGGGGIPSRIMVNGYVAPFLTFGYGSAQSIILMLTNAVPTLLMTTNVIIPGDLTVLGTVTGSGLVFSLTNFTTVTNAIIATNAPDLYPVVSTNMLATALSDTNLYKLSQSYYPTNESVNIGGTNVLTDMAIPYADVNWVTNMYMGRCTNLSDTKYQTAVRMIHGGPATGANIGFDSTLTQVGTWRFTNYAVITFFWNPSTPSVTNALCVPMY